MGKISRYSNLYDKDGNFLHKPGSYTIEELEQLVDTLNKDTVEFSNATAVLMQMYEKNGNPNQDELIQKLLKQAGTKTTKEEIINALNEIKDGDIEEPQVGVQRLDELKTEEDVPDTTGRSEENGSTGSEECDRGNTTSIAA